MSGDGYQPVLDRAPTTFGAATGPVRISLLGSARAAGVDASPHLKGCAVTLVLVFGICLLTAVFVSGIAARTVLSPLLLFLAAGELIGEGGYGLIAVTPESRIVGVLADQPSSSSSSSTGPVSAP